MKRLSRTLVVSLILAHVFALQDPARAQAQAPGVQTLPLPDAQQPGSLQSNSPTIMDGSSALPLAAPAEPGPQGNAAGGHNSAVALPSAGASNGASESAAAGSAAGPKAAAGATGNWAPPSNPGGAPAPTNYARVPTNAAETIPDSLKVPLSTTPQQTATVSTTEGNGTVSASARMLAKTPLKRTRDGNLQFVEVTLRNDSSQVALIHGDIAQANVNGVMKTATSARYVGTVASPKLGLSGRLATGAVTAATLGLAGPIFYENLTPDQHRGRYLGTAVGIDGSRHEIESSRFGLRVLMPGDETVGWLAFECPDGNKISNLVIPVNYSKSSLPSGSLIVPVAKAVPERAEK